MVCTRLGLFHLRTGQDRKECIESILQCAGVCLQDKEHIRLRIHRFLVGNIRSDLEQDLKEHIPVLARTD